MTMRLFLLPLILVLAPAMALANLSDVSCDDSARLTHTLTDVLHAERQGTGLRDPDTFLEVWVTRHNSEWLIVQNYANGTSCIVAMGEHWEGAGPGPS